MALDWKATSSFLVEELSLLDVEATLAIVGRNFQRIAPLLFSTRLNEKEKIEDRDLLIFQVSQLYASQYLLSPLERENFDLPYRIIGYRSFIFNNLNKNFNKNVLNSFDLFSKYEIDEDKILAVNSLMYALRACSRYAMRADETLFRAIKEDIRLVRANQIDLLKHSPIWIRRGPPNWFTSSFQWCMRGGINISYDFSHVEDFYAKIVSGTRVSKDELEIRFSLSRSWLEDGFLVYNKEIGRLLSEKDYFYSRSKDYIQEENLPDARNDVFSSVEFEWKPEGKLAVTSFHGQGPLFPFSSSAVDHIERLNLCRDLANDLLSELDSQRYQASVDYQIQVRRYIERLPGSPGPSGILRADAAIRNLRDLFEADVAVLSNGLASALRGLMQAHLALRPFYPELERLYADIRNGKINEPLPIDAVQAITNIIQSNTPRQFDRSVPEAMGILAEPVVSVAKENNSLVAPGMIQPPPDPLGPIDNPKAKETEQAGMLNRLWLVFKKGKEAKEGIEGWAETASKLSKPIQDILGWINRNWPPGGGDGLPPSLSV
jgi:hypothetical protein